MEAKQEKRYKRHKRVRAKVRGTKNCPRLCVFRSTQHIYGQLIDDEKGVTLVAGSDLELSKRKTKNEKRKTTSKKPVLSKVEGSKLKEEKKELSGKIRVAYQVGQLIAKKALEKKITKVVFDRGGYKYHGRIKALADGTRQGGLKF